MIFEIGMFKDHNLILSRNYYCLRGVREEFKQERRSIVMKVISDLSQNVLQKYITNFANSSYRIIFCTMTPVQENNHPEFHMFIYAIGDLNSDPQIVTPLLQILIDKFFAKFPGESEDMIVDSTRYDAFGTEIDEILKDEKLSPGDRVKSALFKGSRSI